MGEAERAMVVVLSLGFALDACSGRVGELSLDLGGDGSARDGAGGDAGMGRDAAANRATCLDHIPSSCPNCTTSNPAEMPICRRYLQCFASHGCNPSHSCGAMDGVCGVNTVGGGAAPYRAAVATYNCACP